MRGTSANAVGGILEGLFQERPVEASLTPSLPNLPVHNLSDYRLPSGSVNVAAMLQRAEGSLEGRIERFLARTVRTNIWSDELGALSLRSISDPHRHFEKITGSTRLSTQPSEIQQPALREFFEASGRTFFRAGMYETRSSAYYVARSPHLDPLGKLDSMENDMRGVFKILANVDRAQLNPAEFLYFLGALDHLKVHSISLYQVLTHGERRGDISSDVEYSFNKAACLELGKGAVKSYFQHMLGHGVEYRQELEWFQTLASQVFDFLRASEFRERLEEPGRFKLQECDHPVVIGLNAHENALAFPDTQVIVALPLGGLQPGLATQLAFSMVYNREPSLVTAPLSMHSGKEACSGHVSNDLLTQLLRTDVAGKSVLVTEDNSNTGSTINVITQALMSAGAKEVHVSLAELDTMRVRLKQSKEPPSPFMVNLDHRDFSTAVRAVPMRANSAEQGKIGSQMIKLYADRVLQMTAAATSH